MDKVEVAVRRGELQDSIDKALKETEVLLATIDALDAPEDPFYVDQRKLAQQVKGHLIQAAAKSLWKPQPQEGT